MTTHTLTGTATDTLAATDSDTLTVDSTASAPARVVTRSLLANRINWGSVVDSTVQGPTFSDDLAETPALIGGVAAPPADMTVSQIFSVLTPCRFTGCRIYKAPNAVGTDIDVTLWSGVTSGTELATTTIDEWVADDGGWFQVTFPTPVDLEVDTTYVLGYFAEGGIYAYSSWVFNGQDTVVWPIVAKTLFEASGVRSAGNAAISGATITFPTAHNASNYYIDVQVEWDDPLPGYSGGTDYFDQWTHPVSRHAFPLAVFFADPEFLADYYDLGINTLVGGSLSADYIAAHNAMGNTMDWWPYIGTPPHQIVQEQTEYPDIAEQIVGYQLDDEPDMSAPYRSPDLLRTWADYTRVRDSTRPIEVGFGKWVVLDQGFGWSPSGATPQVVNQLWRDWAAMADVIAVDFYTLSDDADTADRYGVWVYAAQVGKLREVSDDRVPVWMTVETTSQTPDQPDPEDVRKAVWASLIAGARGIICFDHRFASDFVTQNFAAMLDDAAMFAMMEDLAPRLMALGDALIGPDLGLVTAWTSSNTTEGPKGGTFGVPLHHTTRSDATYEYAFVQAIRPGATTATITIPTWAGETVDVLDEARTETLDGSGVLTDTFAADYAVHLYRRTL